MISAILIILLGYLLGTIPFGILLCRLLNLGNLRTIGSGNIGATNVLRTGHKTAAILTLTGDIFKGSLAVFIARVVGLGELSWVIGVLAVLGHIYPVWLRFQGGKGVATFLGVLIAIDWRLAVIALGAWLVVAFIWRYSSLAALIATAAVALATFMWHPFIESVIVALLVALIWVKHSSNITRLYHGTEPKIGQPAPPVTTPEA
jgi:glycerol-3-phosphate acyltransferase PlsY